MDQIMDGPEWRVYPEGTKGLERTYGHVTFRLHNQGLSSNTVLPNERQLVALLSVLNRYCKAMEVSDLVCETASRMVWKLWEDHRNEIENKTKGKVVEDAMLALIVMAGYHHSIDLYPLAYELANSKKRFKTLLLRLSPIHLELFGMYDKRKIIMNDILKYANQYRLQRCIDFDLIKTLLEDDARISGRPYHITAKAILYILCRAKSVDISIARLGEHESTLRRAYMRLLRDRVIIHYI